MENVTCPVWFNLCVNDFGVCVCPGLRLRGFKLQGMRSQSPTLAPVDVHSIPWDPVVLPFGTPVAGKSREHAQGGSNGPLYLGFFDSVATAWGLFHNLDSRPL
jgi:hypothetical protein